MNLVPEARSHSQKAGASSPTPERLSLCAPNDEGLPCPPAHTLWAHGGTSTATLKSTMETLVLRCQHTCTMVLPR